MQPERWSEIDALFAAALELAPEERSAFLERACRGEGRLRAAVERLIAADERARSFLERPAPAAAADGEELPAVGSSFGPYRIERFLGRGGMGAVFLASRDDGHFERRVALKLLHGGTRDPEVRERFRAERQTLARLEHPGIARLYDGGETSASLPYLVMEHVEGLPVDVYCDRHRLAVRERLELFHRLLEAVAYAHQNLLVHRDIKPSNVLVTPRGEPKLLDFGIAKRLGGDGAALLTHRRPMTPAYASPEQVRGETVTTASDVYALGVLLYELLCGRRPYRLASDLPHELEAAILAQEPERPSQALDRAPAAGEGSREEVCAARRSRPGELRRALRGDLDTIVLTALRKEPERRYRSVLLLADDLRRHLRARPVSARPDTVGYRAGKFVRRHRIGSALAAAAAVLIAALFGSVLEQRDRAERERNKARGALAFLVDAFQRADPYQKGAENVSARELLATGARRASRELAGDPQVHAALLDAIGQASLGLGQVAEAAPLLERALALRRASAPGTSELADSLEHVGWLQFRRGDFPAAESRLRDSIALRRRVEGGDSPALAAGLNLLGGVLVERYQSTGSERVREIEGLHLEALAIYRRTEGGNGVGAAESYLQLARVAKSRGDLPRSEALHRRALRIHLARQGEGHPATAMIRRALAQALIDQAKFDEAEALLRRTLAAQRRALPEGHPDFMLTANDLGLVHSRRGDYARAEPLYRQVLEYDLAHLGELHAHTTVAMSNLASALQNQGKLAEAAELHARALAAKRAIHGERHIHVAQSLGSLARLRSEQGRHAEARALARQSLAINRELLAPDHPEMAWPLRTMGIVLLAGGEPAAAEPYLRQSLDLLRRTQAPDFFQTAKVEVLLGACLRELGRGAEAEPLVAHGLTALEAQFPPDHPAVREARAALSRRRG